MTPLHPQDLSLALWAASLPLPSKECQDFLATPSLHGCPAPPSYDPVFPGVTSSSFQPQLNPSRQHPAFLSSFLLFLPFSFLSFLPNLLPSLFFPLILTPPSLVSLLSFLVSCDLQKPL